MLPELNDFCAETLGAHRCPSVSVAVAERGEVVLAEAYGLADTATVRPATPRTVYGLASVTKPITATAVCLAADEGLLDLDAPLPGDFPLGAPTARQLLQHRGGFAPHYDFHYGARYGDAPRPIDADPYSVQFRAPGAFVYANLGYRLLGRLLESATGQDLARFVHERVFTPLGLSDCHLGPAYPGPAPSATRYCVDGSAYPDRCDSTHPGATLGWATARELALFAQSYDRLLEPGTAAAMTRNAPPINADLGYGLGWCVSYGEGPVLHSHGGGMGGVAALAVAVPEQRLSVAVLSNSTDKAARDAVAQHVLDALIPGYSPRLITPAINDPARPTPLPAGTWTGRITTPAGPVPATLHLLPGRGRAELHLDGGAATAPVSASAAWDLRAVFPLQLPTADARINSPALGLTLRLLDGRLSGVAYAHKPGGSEGLLGNFLSHPCELRSR